jgi:phosphoribosylformimino-5-aminoimidazole carboxamide ribotide isomerase
MKVIPAIDIRNGKVVRLAQGAVELETVYSDSPVETAARWESFGVELIHVVDLDGALEGFLKNFEIVKEMASRVKCKIELGGGIRDIYAVERVLGAGIAKAVIGTKALDKGFISEVSKDFKERIVVGIDARDGIVRTQGWIFNTEIKVPDLLKRVEGAGIKTVNYTDIARDGMLSGPNIKSLKEVLAATDMEVVASGGISSIEDIKRLSGLEKDGLAGIIIGKALYENKVDLKEAIAICSQKG